MRPRTGTRVAHYDTMFPVDAEVSAAFDIETFRTAHACSALQGDRGEQGLSPGLHWPTSDLFVSGAAPSSAASPSSGMPG